LKKTARGRPRADAGTGGIEMQEWIRLAGPNQSVELFGIRLVGVNAENGTKLLVSLLLVAAVLLVAKAARYAARASSRSVRSERLAFWTRQGISVTTAIALVVVLTSIWFDDPARLATFAGLLTAGLAFALQRVVTALAGYLVILRGDTFSVGDRITMGGVRGDVIALGFLNTTILEMGQPPGVAQQADPAMWVHARQYTGRIVTVTNAKVFDEPVYNYSREFPYLWDEMRVPVPFAADRARAEAILLGAARRHSVRREQLREDDVRELERRYLTRPLDTEPRAFWRLTDNWLEITVRFLCLDHGIRATKDAMARDILRDFDAAGIGIASATFEVVGLPPLRVAKE
jgi:small-conductance mechanosensitive channel